jgi:hypothetical protein
MPFYHDVGAPIERCSLSTFQTMVTIGETLIELCRIPLRFGHSL